MKITPFSTSVWKYNFVTDFSKEIAKCYEIKEKCPSSNRSNQGGYQSPTMNGEDFTKTFPELFESIVPNIAETAKEIGSNFSIDNAWVNINGKNSYNMEHTHPKSALSAVVYLKTQERCGNIVFKNPTLVQHYPCNTALPEFWGEYWLPSEQGTMLVFPAYLSHYVEQNLSDEDRISIAINFSHAN
jgi:uncharacterized protein (TIGR02466 family)